MASRNHNSVSDINWMEKLDFKTDCGTVLLCGEQDIFASNEITNEHCDQATLSLWSVLMQGISILKMQSNITVTSQWARWCLKSSASPLFTQTLIQAQIKENIKVPRHWPSCGEFTGDRWPVTRKMFPFVDVFITYRTVSSFFCTYSSGAAFYWHGLILIPAYLHHKVSNEIA